MSDDLPQPDGPSTATKCSRRSRRSTPYVCSSRPKNSALSSISNRRKPWNGLGSCGIFAKASVATCVLDMEVPFDSVEEVVEPFELVGLTHADRDNVVVYNAEVLAALSLGNNAKLLRAVPLPNQHPAFESQRLGPAGPF